LANMAQSSLATDVIWPTVRALITATLDEDEKSVRSYLRPRSNSADTYDLFGLIAIEILLKTVLDRNDVALARVISTEQGKRVFVEFVWVENGQSSTEYGPAETVTVALQPYRKQWRVADINPSTLEQWLTSPTARGLLSNLMEANEGRIPQESWVLPFAFMGGAMRLAFRPKALRDEVEELLLPGMLERGYGPSALVGGRRLWRAYVKAASPEIGRAALWAAAVEFLMSEQALIDTPQAFVGKQYSVNLVQLLPRIRLIRERLKIDGLDDRFSPVHGVNIVTDG
jgi:hypothetical protein